MYFSQLCLIFMGSQDLSGTCLSLRGPHKLTVSFREATAEEKAKWKPADCAIEAKLEQDPSPKNAQVFADIAVRKVPAGCNFGGLESSYVEEGMFKPGVGIDIEHLPPPCQSFYRQVSDELDDAINRTIRVIRWRMNRGTSQVIAGLGRRFSFDGVEWAIAPHVFENFHDGLSGPSMSDALKDELAERLGRGQDEPLYHRIFREAYRAFSTSPRTAVVLSITSAEIGFKMLVADVLPAAEWLIMNLPSPPLSSMLAEYLPKLPVRLRINNKVLPPPQNVSKELRDGVKIRNELVHKDTEPPEPDKVQRILLAVRDFLWLLDFYRGAAWAARYVRRSTWESLVNEAGAMGSTPDN